MSKTLTAGDCKLLLTRGVNDRIADDSKFSAFVWESLRRFNRGDWGNVSPNSWEANDADLKALNNGLTDARILADYKGNYIPKWPFNLNELPDRVWITRNVAESDGTQAITVLFPDEY